MNTNKRVFKMAFISMGCVVAVVLSFLEGLIPQFAFMPPGAKIGLSNVVTMYTSYYIGLFPSLAISVVKSFFVLITRGTMAFMMSISGGFVSTLAAYLLFALKKKLEQKNSDYNISFIFIGICSALCHNMTQYAVICVLVSSDMYYYIPFLIIFSVLTGCLTGMMLKIVLPVLNFKNINTAKNLKNKKNLH